MQYNTIQYMLIDKVRWVAIRTYCVMHCSHDA